MVVFEKGSEISEILTNLQSVAMFEGERLIIWENSPEEVLKDLPHTPYPIPHTLVLWFDHEVKQLPEKDFEILFFPEAKEVSVFPFLDMLAAGRKEAYLELKKLKDGGYDIQYIITMIFYLLRSLAVTPKNAPPFVKNKLSKQRERFKEGELIGLYRFILETDFKIKSGLLEPTQAEFLLVNKFI